uniref:Uncharacterized protein n=1 Tax=Romanomermis culicivorax TaxID=13658 RepID=A0A915HYV4_ROMCU
MKGHWYCIRTSLSPSWASLTIRPELDYPMLCCQLGCKWLLPNGEQTTHLPSMVEKYFENDNIYAPRRLCLFTTMTNANLYTKK